MTQSDFMEGSSEVVSTSAAQEIATIAEQAGARVFRGRIFYPAETGAFSIGPVDLDGYLYELRDLDIILVLAIVGEGEMPSVCPECGTAYRGAECPQCRVERDDIEGVPYVRIT